MKKFILIILCAAFIFSACSDKIENENIETNLANILKSYRENGMTLWWDILAVYNADENPIDYKGFDGVLAQFEEAKNNTERAVYVIIVNIAVIIGADEGYFEQYDNYKKRLKSLLENPDGDNISEYIYAYYAIKTSGENFDENPIRNYLREIQEDDGSFGSVEMTILALPALKLLYYPLDPNGMQFTAGWDNIPPAYAADFLCGNIKEDNAAVTASALSALIGYYGLEIENEKIRQLQESLTLFEKSGGYANLQGGARDNLATAQGALALGDSRGIYDGWIYTDVWIKLYLESLDAFYDD